MFIWTKESINWLDFANSYTNYSKNLNLKLLPYLKPHYNILEIACGTGHLALELAPHVKSVTAVDISQLSIDFFKEKVKNSSVDNIEIICDDWKNLLDRGRKFDVVLFSYFGAILEDFKYLKEFTPKTIIPILPYFKPNSRYSRKRENVENVENFLKDENINYSLIKITLEYGQPFTHMEDAMKYMSHYYSDFTTEQNSDFLNKNLIKENTYLYLPKQKELGIFIIDL